MSKNSSDGVWEDIVLVVVFGAFAVLGYRRLKPKVEGWLECHGIHIGDLTDQARSVPLELLVDVGAAVLGITLLVALWRGWRKVRGRRKDGDKKKPRVWR